MIIFSLFIFIVMLMFGGIAVDLMLYENKRTHVQNSTDRAVLAAANLNQSVDPKSVVADYLNKAGVAVQDDDIDVYEIGTAPVITGRQVAVNVTGAFDTILMHLVGVNSLSYNASSQAEESVNDIEVSLILDISGSMGSNSKLSNMQSAAKDFVSGILEGASDDRVSVSLVPYSTQVSAGPELLAQLSTTHNHSSSHCVNFETADFGTTAIQRVNPGNGTPIALSQTAHFDPWRHYNSGRSLYYPVCRSNSYAEILPWSNDAIEINNQIDDLTARGNTSIDVAVKWGAALLDPSMNSALNALIANPNVTVDSAFSPRPHPYTNTDALKFIVVMTDGINTRQYYLRDSYKEGLSDMYRTGTPSNPQYVMHLPGNSSNQRWWNLNTRNYVSAPSNDPTTLAAMRLTKLAMWSQMSMKWRAYNGFYRRTWNADDYYDELYDPRTYTNDTAKDDRMEDICDAAKDEGIVIFSIGFEVTDHSANVMRDCASTPNHFYRVEGLDIEYAFASIKNQINQLKLTQSDNLPSSFENA
ncbi:MAG: hypothetical protein HKN18_00315 [Silicimonas sp.]|nr:hypothetical protein [Silicimonas sp.]